MSIRHQSLTTYTLPSVLMDEQGVVVGVLINGPTLDLIIKVRAGGGEVEEPATEGRVNYEVAFICVSFLVFFIFLDVTVRFDTGGILDLSGRLMIRTGLSCRI